MRKILKGYILDVITKMDWDKAKENFDGQMAKSSKAVGSTD